MLLIRSTHVHVQLYMQALCSFSFLTGIGCHSILSFQISSAVGMNSAANTNLRAKDRTDNINSKCIYLLTKANGILPLDTNCAVAKLRSKSVDIVYILFGEY